MLKEAERLTANAIEHAVRMVNYNAADHGDTLHRCGELSAVINQVDWLLSMLDRQILLGSDPGTTRGKIGEIREYITKYVDTERRN